MEKADSLVEGQPPGQGVGNSGWKLLIVDDEQSVHDVTRLALNEFEFEGQPLQIINAFSADEARQILKDNPDIAVILLDVVMETKNAGLLLVDFIRQELRNTYVRIILRTGQPGEAPEHEVIRQYDINDYKDKTELTASKLYTVVYTGLRAYKDLVTLEKSRRGLEKLVGSISALFHAHSVREFAQGVLEQLVSLLSLRPDAVLLYSANDESREDGFELKVVAATGRYAGIPCTYAGEILEDDLLILIEQVRRVGKSDDGEKYYVHYAKTAQGGETLLYVASKEKISSADKFLIHLYGQNVTIAHEHVLKLEK